MDAHLTFEDIDPEIAQVYLGRNLENNRHLLPERVERIARDMSNGDWITTADPIKFNKEGKLIDGQHRLAGVMKSGQTIRFLVARDLDEDAVYVIDTGATRTTAQALKIADTDMKSRSTVVAAAQLVHVYDKGALPNVASHVQTKDRMTNVEAIHYIENHREALEQGVRMAHFVAPALPLAGSMVAAAYMILARIDTFAAAEFFNRIKQGSGGEEMNDPIATLIRRVYRDKMENRKITPALAFFYIFRTWNAWRESERLSKLQAGSVTGVAALPQPK